MCVKATSETSGHIGALLMLMSLSICLGGIVERSEIMNLFPQSFGSSHGNHEPLGCGSGHHWYDNGSIRCGYSGYSIHCGCGVPKRHRSSAFLMVVIVAFELGYLTPPVALNHLLTRQVIGEEEYKDLAPEGAGFWTRHERILLPMVVLAIALVIVAFAPFYF